MQYGRVQKFLSLFLLVICFTIRLSWGFGFGLSPEETNGLWTKGIVYYKICPEMTKPERVAEAILEWEAETPIRFVQRTNEANYALFCNSDKNYSASRVGQGKGMQTISISRTASTGIVLHEIGHLIGLHHEHQRPDRDKKDGKYRFELNEDNIDNYSENERDYQKKNHSWLKTYTEYDPYSIMHYPYTRGSDSEFTITDSRGRRLSYGQDGVGRHLTSLDKSTIAEMYAQEFKKRGGTEIAKVDPIIRIIKKNPDPKVAEPQLRTGMKVKLSDGSIGTWKGSRVQNELLISFGEFDSRWCDISELTPLPEKADTSTEGKPAPKVVEPELRPGMKFKLNDGSIGTWKGSRFQNELLIWFDEFDSRWCDISELSPVVTEVDSTTEQVKRPRPNVAKPDRSPIKGSPSKAEKFELWAGMKFMLRDGSTGTWDGDRFRGKLNIKLHSGKYQLCDLSELTPL